MSTEIKTLNFADGFQCNLCKRLFQTQRGRSAHLNHCLKKQKSSSVAALGSSYSGQPESFVIGSNEIEFENTTDNHLSPDANIPKVWGLHTKEDLHQILNATYEEIVLWRRNVFKLPTGGAGKKFIAETTSLINMWNSESMEMKDVALKAVMVMPALLLQKPSFKSKCKQHNECLQRRLNLWKLGDFDGLLKECRAIQSRLQSTWKPRSPEHVSRTFANLMLSGKVNAAMRLLDDTSTSGVLKLSEETLRELKAKHPEAMEADKEILIAGQVPFVDPAMFSIIDESTIARAALHTKGAAGPSGLDADGWRRILVSKNFGTAGTELRSSLAEMARILCTKEPKADSDHQSSIEAYVACRLIPLDKCPGVRPIGIGEVIRRIIGKSIISVIKPDILMSTGSLQLAAGLPSGCEAAAHAMEEIFQEEETDAILLVDASNAFNSLNRQVLLHNIRYLCPPMATYVKNCYGSPSRLFVMGGKEILSQEGTTQGDPMAMPAYTVGIAPLLKMIQVREDDVSTASDEKVKHAAYADDLGGAGVLGYLRTWWNKVVHFGPLLGYYPKASKSWLVVKEDRMDAAREIFADTDINITSEGRAYLGGFVGSKESRENYAKELVKKWCEQLMMLSKIAHAVGTTGSVCSICFWFST